MTRADRKAFRRELAESMRAAGRRPSGADWDAALADAITRIGV